MTVYDHFRPPALDISAKRIFRKDKSYSSSFIFLFAPNCNFLVLICVFLFYILVDFCNIHFTCIILVCTLCIYCQTVSSSLYLFLSFKVQKIYFVLFYFLLFLLQGFIKFIKVKLNQLESERESDIFPLIYHYFT